MVGTVGEKVTFKISSLKYRPTQFLFSVAVLGSKNHFLLTVMLLFYFLFFLPTQDVIFSKV